jgi:hypothetical protein
MRSRIALAACCCACAVLAGCDRPRPLSPPGQKAYELSLATDGHHLVAAWNGGESGNAIWIRLIDDAGKPTGTSIPLTDGKRDAYEPDIQLLEGDLLVAWYEKDAATGALTARLGRFTLTGQPRWQVALSSPGSKGRNAVVRVHGGQALVAWIEATGGAEPAVWTAGVAADGAFVQPPQRRATVSAETWNLNAAVDAAGRLYVVYDAWLGSRAKELHLLTVEGESATDHMLSGDDGHDSVYPDIALSGEHAALTWFDTRDGNSEVYLSVGDLAGVSTLESRGVRITHTPGASIGAYVAWNGQRLGLAWCDDIAGQSEVFIQRFSASGTASATAHRVTRNPTQSSIPAIQPWQDGFALAWNEYQAENAEGHPAIVASTAVLSLIR